MHSRSNAKCAWPLRKDDTLQPMLSAQNSATASVTDSSYDVVLASLDIKDAFLQVPQSDVIEVWLYDQQYLIKRILPGQRLGAKAWYWHFRSHVTDALGFTWCAVLLSQMR